MEECIVDRRMEDLRCPECGSEMARVYDIEEIEEEFKPEGLNRLAALRAQYALLRIMTCPKCRFTKQLSALEIMSEFARMQKENGKTDSEIIDLVKEEKRKYLS